MGYAIARTLAELGAKVVIADRDADAGVSNSLIWQS
jgi:NAD(P)-dependent dehydrogenase (short-subunit alcohol dehydrogenase family)